MRGNPDSCGIWAPDLSWKDGLFHLIYTDVKRYGRTTTAGASGASLRDFHNYLVTAPAIEGAWSDPIHLNSSGFDPALFHDEDGRSWLLNMLWDHRPGRNRFAGIVIQEYDAGKQALVGERVNIFRGTPLGLTEGPHLFKRDGVYHLLVAEGGTHWGHAVTMARSRSLLGPYELHPQTPLLTARDKPDAPLHRAGHADLVETPAGETYMVYLCGRPLPNRGRCILGRETAIQKMVWGGDGWLRPAEGEGAPVLETAAPDLPPAPWTAAPEREDFDGPDLPPAFQWLRTSEPERIFSLSARPGHLRLHGRETIGSLFTQALVARRLQAFSCSVRTRMDFEPEHFQQAAGLVLYYNGAKFHYLHVGHDEEIGRHIRVMSAIPDAPMADAFTPPLPLPPGPVELRAELDRERLLFAFRSEGDADWTWLPELFDASILSDEATAPGLPNFTGAFAGMACQDLAGTSRPADFDWFDYVERDYRPDAGG
jgi:xylan 1,4-beta-xylosidase